MIEYLKTNNTSEVKADIVWEVFKAVLRGNLIKFNSITKKKKGEHYLQMDEKIGKIESKLKNKTKPGNKKLNS